MINLVKLTGGILVAAAFSQFPEYSAQYVQRMGGALDELATVVVDFDTSANASGYTRKQALSVMTGSEFLEARQSDMTRTFNRYDKLSSDYTRLKNANAFSRLAYVARMRDGEIANGTAKDFKPAVPLTFEGAGFVGIGFLMGYSLFAGLLHMIRRPRKKVEL